VAPELGRDQGVGEEAGVGGGDTFDPQYGGSESSKTLRGPAKR
jgi:hypothetical protein